MQDLLHVEISSIGICLLAIIIFNQRQNTGSSTLQRQFSLLVYSTVAILVVDSLCWVVDGTQFPYARSINIIVEMLYYLLSILIPYIWAVYVELALNKDPNMMNHKPWILGLPLAILTVFLIFNLKTGSVFIVDESNVYHRNSGYLAYGLLGYLYMGHASVRALKAARRASWNEDRRRYYLIAFFVVFPAVSGIIQIFIYGISFTWVFVALSILQIYIDSLNRQISTDPLTGINNRRELTKYLLRETKDDGFHGVLALIMMDVDGFKQVNDTYGHYYGDGVLVAVSELLKQSCKNTPAFVARYGGDEFCIVFPSENIKAVESMISGIQSNVLNWNRMHNEPGIGLSIGYSVWNPETDENLNDLFKRADHNMYKAKNAKKSADVK